MSRTKEHYHEEISRGLNQPDDLDYQYEEHLRLEALRKYPHIEATAAKRPEDLGYAAAEKGITAPADDVHWLSWVTAKRMATGSMGTDEFLQAVQSWIEGNRQAEADLHSIESWEAEEADREHPRWTVGAA